jgi:electron transport complex protein RnfB
MISGVIFAGVFMAILGSGLAWMLAAANKRLYVYEDPRIDQVSELLPQSNCGACGTAGCRNFAENLVEGKVQPSGCTVNTPDMNAYIASFLGVELGDADKRVARLACAGGRHVARLRAHYEGLGSCRAAATVAGGGKDCAWGCLGLGDCESVCDFDAISMNQFGLPVVDTAKCTACGDCVEVCPKELFSLHSLSHKLWVACKNQADGDTAERQCEVACTACGRCVQDSAEGLMKLDGELAAVDYSLNQLATRKSIERCPTGAIVWLEEGLAEKGKAAKKIVRITPLPVASEV